MTVTGPSFVALQVRDLDRAADFYESHLSLDRAPVAPPGPFGRQFTFVDPDGYAVTVHDRA